MRTYLSLADIVITNFECIFLCQTFPSMYVAHVATMVGDVIGASASEPHTSEFNGGISMCRSSNAHVHTTNAGNMRVI